MALISTRAYQMRAARVQAIRAAQKREDDLRIAVGVGRGVTAPTDITLSNNTIPEDLAVGLSVGTLSVVGSESALSIVSDADNKFALSGADLTIDGALDYEAKTSHAVTIRAENAAGFFEKEFTITVTDVDETTAPPIDPATVTPVSSGTFDVTPVFGKSNGKGKGQGKSNALATVVYSIGAVVAGATYIMRTTADLSLLSNQGKDTLTGFGMKDGNQFHMVGLKGNGSTGQDPTTIQGNWNSLNSVTITDKGTNTNGTQYVALSKIAFSSDGTKYTYSTGTGSDPDTAVWTAEIVDQTVSNITDLTTAETFGPSMFFPASDIGQFTIEIDVWRAQLPLWTPTQLGADLLGWYDGSLLTGSDNDVKTTWADQSGNSRTLNHGIGNNTTLRTAFLNGKNVMSFPGAYINAPNVYTGKTAASLFVVGKKNSDDDAGGLHNLSSSGQNQHFQYSDGNIYDGFFSTTRGNRGNPSFSLASWRIINLHSSANNYALYFDGTAFATSSSNTAMTPAAFSIGAGDAATTYVWTGHMAEILCIGVVLSQSNREKVEGYLAHKWGLTGNLGSGHPYKTNPPLT